MVKEIRCFNGEIALVDDDDYPLLSRHKWYYAGGKDHEYVFCHINGTSRETRTVYMHNMIIGMAVNVDHKDSSRLNNQKNNIRAATRPENEWNKGKQKTFRGGPCTSKYKGVSLQKNGSWKAMIMRNGVLYDLSNYRNEEDAARAYNKKAAELSGKYLWLNPVPEINQGV